LEFKCEFRSLINLCVTLCGLPFVSSSPNNISLEVSHGSISSILPRLHASTPATTRLFCWATLATNLRPFYIFFFRMETLPAHLKPTHHKHSVRVLSHVFHLFLSRKSFAVRVSFNTLTSASNYHECQSFVRKSVQRFLLTCETFLASYELGFMINAFHVAVRFVLDDIYSSFPSGYLSSPIKGWPTFCTGSFD